MSAAGWTPTQVDVTATTIAGDNPYDVIDPVWWIADFYADLATHERSLSQFSRPQRLVWAVLWYSSEVHNGGHDQFFSNSTGMVWPDALEGLARIGRDDLKDILDKAIARFPAQPPRDQDEREQQMTDFDVSFSGLDEEHWGQCRAIDLHESLMAYIRRQPEAFLFSGVVTRPPRKREAKPQ